MLAWLLSTMLVMPCPGCGMTWLTSALATESTAVADCDCCDHVHDVPTDPHGPDHRPACVCHTPVVPALQKVRFTVPHPEFIAVVEMDLPHAVMPDGTGMEIRSATRRLIDLARSSPLRQ